jgi:hypothetical protein
MLSNLGRVAVAAADCPRLMAVPLVTRRSNVQMLPPPDVQSCDHVVMSWTNPQLGGSLDSSTFARSIRGLRG